VAMQRAELEWVMRLIRDIEGGSLWITKEHMKAVEETFENSKQGGDRG
jgi:hypothetical protein